MSESASVLPRSSASETDAVDSLPPPAMRLQNVLAAIASGSGVRDVNAIQISLSLKFWSALPNWFCDQSRSLIEHAVDDSSMACAVAIIRHLVLRRDALQLIEGQINCMHELHELRYCYTELGASVPIVPSVSVYENACVAACLRVLSQEYDPFRWRHRATPETLTAQEKAFDEAVFQFCLIAPSLRDAPAGIMRRGVGFAPTRVLILAALQQYFGFPFEPRPVSQRNTLVSTLEHGLPIVIVGGSGPIDGDDTKHAWVCRRWQQENGHVEIFDPASASMYRQPLTPFLDRLSSDSLAFVCTSA